MKTKLFMMVCLLGISLFFPKTSHAQLTEENLELQSNWDAEFGPVSLQPEYLTATLSHVNRTITGTFAFNYGYVTFWIVSEKGELCLSEEVNAVANGSYYLDLSKLKAGKYRLQCYLPGEPTQVANFELH
ncbi:hypothetical protein [Odoribacter lunatus]|uniref:hypothetical protein n=1 Tax=Odoribacter lunatus TaxID=2941335 RepID=UPI00203E44A2|nr:hypothetical protein [Odoribacter lunatus]